MVNQINGEVEPLLRHGPETTREPITSSESHFRDETPRRLILKTIAAMICFTTLGILGSNIGALLPDLLLYFDLSYTSVSLVFLAGPVMYIFASGANAIVHQRLGRLGVVAIGSCLQILALYLLSINYHFALVLLGLGIQGLSNGLLDGTFCAWAGGMQVRASTISGFLHASYSAGAAIGPFVLSFAVQAGYKWYDWYQVLLVLSILEAPFIVFAFADEKAPANRSDHTRDAFTYKQRLQMILRSTAFWFAAAYSLIDVASELAITGWVVAFMLNGRGAEQSVAKLTLSMFCLGMAIGRLLLGFVTERFGVFRTMPNYFAIALIAQAGFTWIISPTTSLVLMLILGVFIGPMFPSGIVVLAGALPVDSHVQAISLVASVGQVGGALLPFATGALIEAFGIWIFPFVVLVSLGAAATMWICLSKAARVTSA